MTNNSHELLCAIALTQLSHYSLAAVLQLYRTLGSAKAVIDHRHDIRDIIPDAVRVSLRSFQTSTTR